MKLYRKDLYVLIESYLSLNENEEVKELDDTKKESDVKSIQKDFTVTTSKGTHKFKISIDEKTGVVVDKISEDGAKESELLKLVKDDEQKQGSDVDTENHRLSNIIAGIAKATTKITNKDERKEKQAEMQGVIDSIKAYLDNFSLSDKTLRTHLVNFESEFGLIKNAV